MTSQEMIVPDLTSDNFDLLRFPSLPGFPSMNADNDDLTMMARMGSLLDAKPPATVSSPQSANVCPLPQQPHPMHQHIRYRPAVMQQQPLLNTQQTLPFSNEYPVVSPPSSAATTAQAFIPPHPSMMVRKFATMLCSCCSHPVSHLPEYGWSLCVVLASKPAGHQFGTSCSGTCHLTCLYV